VARTLSQIEASLSFSIEEQDPSIDTVKGPVFDIFIRPQAAQLRATELLFDDLSRRYSLDYVLSQNAGVLVLYGANHGLRKSPGRAARGNVVFFMFAAIGSGEVVVIPAGTVVTTTDPSIAFRTIRDAFIIGSSLPAFFNASNRRYEIRVPVEALGSGSLFEVPPRRVTNIISEVEGIDGVINFERIEGSTEIETNTRFGQRIRSKFNGLALGSGSGLEQLVRNFNTASIDDVVLIFSTDFDNFRRRTRRAAWDVYLIGSEPDTSETTFVGDGVLRRFTLPLAPVLAVTDVAVNGLSVNFTFLPDTTDQLKASSRAADVVELDSIPGLNDTITVSYSFDKLIRDVQEYVDRIGIQLYRADILVRKAVPVPIRARILVQVLSSFDETDAASSAFATAIEFINPGQFVSLLFANDLRRQLSADVAGVANIDMLEFTRDLTGTIPIETVEFKPFEFAESPDSLVTIEVRR
jgi:hypothetical protein